MTQQHFTRGFLMIMILMSVFLTAFSGPERLIDQPVIDHHASSVQTGDDPNVSGDKIRREDWVAHLPLACVSVVVVMVVNSVFLGKIILNRRQSQSGG